jgi:Zn-dependent protease
MAFMALPAAMLLPAVPALAAGQVAFRSPLFWAVFLGWILSVVLHEFAHGIVAYWGGDYTIRERGGLTLNPLQYIHPVTSIILPMIFLLMGGVPLPGGATYIQRDLLRSRAWDAAVSAAGPAMNFLLFLALGLCLHPRVGWVDPFTPVSDWTPGQKFVAALTFLQLFSVFLNLIPFPPLDGFNIVAAYMKPEAREKLMTPPVSTGMFVMLFFLISSPGVGRFLTARMEPVIEMIGLEYDRLALAYLMVMRGE